MLASPSSCPAPNYSHIVHTPGGSALVTLQLNYNTNIVLELKVKLAKINTKVKETKKQLSVIHLSSINGVIHSEKSNLVINTPFWDKYHFQNLKNKNSVPLQDIKIEKKTRKSTL